MGTGQTVTEVLQAAARGDSAAREQLWVSVYDELRRAAHRALRNDRGHPTLQTTVLVHDAYIRLTGGTPHAWNSRRHFFAAAAQAMQRILVDAARERAAQKRGGDRRRVPLDEAPARLDGEGSDILALDEALGRLEAELPRTAEVVRLRFFAGLSVDDTAAALDISPRTVDAEWQFARAWLFRAVNT